jgi:glyoxylase-like metal-dependent hydrolase (beta-lactamase superfamily II)
MSNLPTNVPAFRLEDSLAWLHGKRKRDVYVLLSEDGSTLVVDPGLNRPWSSPNKLYAEHQAKQISKESGRTCYATDLETAIHSVIKHPKNQPTGKS